jgi:hypothetical protein
MRHTFLNKDLIVTLADGETEATVNVEFKVWPGSPGYYSGAPEDCYEAEAADWEVAEWVIENKEPQLSEAYRAIRAVEDALYQRRVNRHNKVLDTPNEVLDTIEAQIDERASDEMDQWLEDEGDDYDGG